MKKNITSEKETNASKIFLNILEIVIAHKYTNLYFV